MGQFTKPVTDETFDAEVVKSSTPVLVDFWAEWCPPCKAIAPKLEEIGQELGSKIKIVKMDVDSNQNTAAQFGIRSIPTLLFFKNGKMVDQILGNHPKDNLIEFINKNI